MIVLREKSATEEEGDPGKIKDEQKEEERRENSGSRMIMGGHCGL